MEDKITVSIIVPVYNVESYIEECVDSLLGQSFRDFEILLIDDGSTDRSGEIIREKYSRETRVRYVRKENEGVSASRNRGLALAKGDYIGFVDADDWVDSNFLSHAMKWIEQYGLDLVLGGTVKVYSDSRKFCCAQTEEEILVYDNPEKLRMKVLSNGTYPRELAKCFTSGVVCRIFGRKLLENLCFDPDLTIGEDTVFNLSALEHAGRIGVTGEAWYYYRIHSQSVTRRVDREAEKENAGLLYVLCEKYGNLTRYRSFLVTRAVQQFHGMLLSDILSRGSDLSLQKKRRKISDYLKQEPWRSVFSLELKQQLQATVFDRMLYVFCKKRWSFCIILLIQLRLWGKAAEKYVKRLRKS